MNEEVFENIYRKNLEERIIAYLTETKIFLMKIKLI